MNFDEFLNESVVGKAIADHYGATHSEKVFSKKVKEGTDHEKGHTGHLSAWHDSDEDQWHVSHVTLDKDRKLVKHDSMPRKSFDTKKEAVDHVNSQS